MGVGFAPSALKNAMCIGFSIVWIFKPFMSFGVRMGLWLLVT